MTPLDAVRRLVEARVTCEGTDLCHYCRQLVDDPDWFNPPKPRSEQHADDCPVRALPKILAALEAAERVAAAYVDLDRYEGQLDHSDEEWAAMAGLAAALRGEESL
jgi:hypothetical protein